MENNNGKFFGVLTRSALIVRTERAAVRFCAALTPAGLALIGEEARLAYLNDLVRIADTLLESAS